MYCSNSGYRQMCCKSCSEGNHTSSLNLTSKTWTYNTATPMVRNVTQLYTFAEVPITHSTYTTIKPSLGRPGTPSGSAVPWKNLTILNPLILRRGSTFPITTDVTLEEMDGPSTMGDEEETSELWPVFTTEDLLESSSWFEELLSITFQSTAMPKYVTEKLAAPQMVTTPADTTPPESKIIITSPPAIVSLHRSNDRKENNSIDVSYKVVDLNEVPQNHFIPRKRVPFREKTQNKRIQELLAEKRRQDFLLRRLKRKHGD